MNAIESGIGLHELLSKLFNFWEKFECVFVPPCQTEISSAIFHPNSFFSMIDNANYNIMYFQPQFPVQNRNIEYNVNNNCFLEFQVILKKNIDNPQKIFLNSLYCLNIDTLNSDIIFENDYYENFVFRMTANGYIVYFNGMYIAKIYYIQNIASCDFNCIPLYISYNLEKILGLLKNNYNSDQNSEYNDIQFKINKDNYNFISNDFTSELILNEFENYKNIAIKLLDNSNITSAYIFILKAKHCLDLLNFRNYINSSNRINYNTILRDLLDRCCNDYIKNKQMVK